MNQTECESFNEGILKQGLYSSVIKYWDYLRQLNSDFFSSNRSATVVRNFINDDSLAVEEKMQQYYFKISLDTLVSKLEDDIDTLYSISVVTLG
ncbi:MAG: hypothetical protein P4M11_15445 [Candidatus Pacebacteria bacterium]|nr:hypothetical protein [Candidatus Paceibacterota bacterium]